VKEFGIFDALEKEYLEVIQISICADSNCPSEVIECYTFAFTYGSSSLRSGRGVSVTISPGSSTVFFVGDAQKSFNAAIKGFLKRISNLPQLPRE
jgi:HORMA domain